MGEPGDLPCAQKSGLSRFIGPYADLALEMPGNIGDFPVGNR